MTTFWYYNAYDGEIDSYRESGELNDFPRGLFLAYRDYITTGLKSRSAAEKWAENICVCPKCKDAKLGKVGEPCFICKTPLLASPINPKQNASLKHN